jgi:Gram-negative bacterial TonB protein C-terminal
VRIDATLLALFSAVPLLSARAQAVGDSPGVSVHAGAPLMHRAPVHRPPGSPNGTVVVEALVDARGNVTDARVLSGPDALRKSALESVLEWHYSIADGAPAPIQASIVFAEPAPPPPESPVRITQFYAAPPAPHKGEKALVCYGVENADQVRINPPVEKVWPALARCFDYLPVKTTLLTLTASRGAAQVSQSITVEVGPPAVKILEVSISKIEVARGEKVTVCYKSKNAVKASMKPGKVIFAPRPDSGCVEDRPEKTTTYVVTVTGAGGDSDTERVTARVK